jgi:hypothetical protein
MTPKLETETSNNDIVCRICGDVREPHQFCCYECYRRLLSNFRRSFAVLKLQSFWWLREHPSPNQ